MGKKPGTSSREDRKNGSLVLSRKGPVLRNAGKGGSTETIRAKSPRLQSKSQNARHADPPSFER